MASAKVTFSLAPETVAVLNELADRLGKSKSRVVQDAIHDYHARTDRLTEGERVRMLAAFDELSPKLAARTDEDVAQEIEEIRGSRRLGGRLTPVE